MKYKDFSEEIWKSIEHNTDLILRQDPKPVAAFDADGTLWDMDFGEALFQYEIDHMLLPLPCDPWEHYQNLKALPEGPQKAYVWLAQIHKEVSILKVREWALACLEALKPVPIFQAQKKLIELLHAKGIEVYVVTASVKWAVEPAAALLGIPEKNVLGVTTRIENQIITDELEGVVTYKQGKVDSLLLATHNKLPFLASGNTEGDLPLLEAATHVRIAVSASSRDDRLYKTEHNLLQHAISKNWFYHKFI